MFGGISTEHEVSVITGVQVAHAADRSKYNVIPIYLSKVGKWYTGQKLLEMSSYANLETIPLEGREVSIDLNNPQFIFVKTGGLFRKHAKIQLDVIFPCFHGGSGENGAIQGLLDLLDVPYVGSGVLGSSLGMDKVVMKQVLDQNGIKVAPYVYFYKPAWTTTKEKIISELETKLGYPMFVKPANSGSSVGVAKVTSKSALENAVDVALAFDRKVIVETGIEGYKEINVSVLGISGEDLMVSECEEVFASKDFLSYTDKYSGGGGKSKGMASTQREIPAKLTPVAKKLIQETAKKAFTVLNAGGLARLDFLFNPNTNDYYLIEINTIPGSMSFYLWEATNMPFTNMVDNLIEVALKTYAYKTNRITTYSSNILKDFKTSLKSPKLG